MNSKNDSIEKSGPPPENPKEVRREVLNLLKETHPDSVPALQVHTKEVQRILTELLDDAATGRISRTWDELAVSHVQASEDQKIRSSAPYRQGDPVRFVRKDDEGNVHDAEFQLPKWIRAFRKALAAFYQGKSDDEVRAILEHDPIVADRNARRALTGTIDTAKTVNDLIKVQEKIQESNVLLTETRRKLLREIVGRIAAAYMPLVSHAERMSDLRSVSRDVRELIEESSIAAKDDKNYFLGILSAITDVRAESIGSALLENLEDEESLNRIGSYITTIESFPFADSTKKAELLNRGNEMARGLFMESMKRTKTEKGLNKLHEYVYRFPFSLDDAGEATRNDIQNWIEKKWYSYLSPEALKAQTSMRANTERKE